MTVKEFIKILEKYDCPEQELSTVLVIREPSGRRHFEIGDVVLMEYILLIPGDLY